MVLLHVKTDDDFQFLVETSTQTAVEEIEALLVEVDGLRRRIEELAAAVSRLSEGVVESETAGLDRALGDALQAVHKDQIARKVCVTPAMLEDALHAAHTAAVAAFPTDPSLAELLDSPQPQLDLALWFVRKQMLPGKHLHDYVGRNEKTRALVKLRPVQRGPPGREIERIDEDIQKAMLAWNLKRQQEEQRMAEDETDASGSSWANPAALKQHFSGVGNLRLA